MIRWIRIRCGSLTPCLYNTPSILLENPGPSPTNQVSPSSLTSFETRVNMTTRGPLIMVYCWMRLSPGGLNILSAAFDSAQGEPVQHPVNRTRRFYGHRPAPDVQYAVESLWPRPLLPDHGLCEQDPARYPGGRHAPRPAR